MLTRVSFEMIMMSLLKNSTSGSLLLFTLLILFSTGCTVSYSTSDVDKSLKQFITAVSDNKQVAIKAYDSANAQYKKLRCNENEEPFNSLHKKLRTLSLHVDTIGLLKNKVQAEYDQFRRYTKGESKIISGTPAYKSLKETKKSMKQLHKELTKKGEEISTLSEEYQSYWNKQIITAVIVYQRSDYLGRYQKIVNDLSNFQGEMDKALMSYQKIMLDQRAKFGKSHPDECKELDANLACVYVKKARYAEGQKAVQTLLNKATVQTVDWPEIYSSFPEWQLVQDNEDSLLEEWKKMQNTQSEIQLCLDNCAHIALASF